MHKVITLVSVFTILLLVSCNSGESDKCLNSYGQTKVTEYFSDSYFLSAIRNLLDIAEDAPIFAESVNNKKVLDLGFSPIVDLSGIEHFTSLEVLRLDSNGRLTNVNLCRNTNRTHIYLFDTNFAYLNLSNIPNLLEVRLGHAHELELLNISDNGNLKVLIIGRAINLSTLDVLSNANLRKLVITDSLIEKFDLSANVQLEVLNINRFYVSSHIPEVGG